VISNAYVRTVNFRSPSDRELRDAASAKRGYDPKDTIFQFEPPTRAGAAAPTVATGIDRRRRERQCLVPV
jgi:hypothetical protein